MQLVFSNGLPSACTVVFFSFSFQFLSLLIQLLIVPALLYFYLLILRRDLLGEQ